MGKKKDQIDINDPQARCCPTCSQWGNEDRVEFPCALAKIVVVRARPRVGCSKWRAE